MIFNRTNTKSYVLCALIFVTGMLSVSVSNFFGGYYCGVAAIETILLTMFLYGVFDKKDGFKENFVSLVLASFITLLGIVFFVCNDVFDVNVYSKNNLNFWSYSVIISQALSIASLIYLAITVVIGLNKEKIEVIDHRVNEEEKHNKETEMHKTEKIVKEERYVDENIETTERIEESLKKEFKSITENNVKIKTPFMEEER